MNPWKESSKIKSITMPWQVPQNSAKYNTMIYNIAFLAEFNNVKVFAYWFSKVKFIFNIIYYTLKHDIF